MVKNVAPFQGLTDISMESIKTEVSDKLKMVNTFSNQLCIFKEEKKGGHSALPSDRWRDPTAHMVTKTLPMAPTG